MKPGLIKPICLESGQTANASLHMHHCLPEVFRAVSEQRSNIDIRGLILHDDSAESYRAWITNEFLFENHVKSYPGSPNSPDLSPCNFFLLPKLKKQLR